MAEIVENEEKVFEKFSIMPPEVRMMFVDEMEPDDRCRFTRCSEQSQKEAKSSKKFIYGLTFDAEYFVRRSVEVHFDDQGNHGFSYRFIDQRYRKFLIYSSLKNEELWRVELPFSKDSFQMAIQRFEDLLKMYQNTIKKLDITRRLFGGDWKNIDVKIKNFENLETLGINSDSDKIFSRISSKLRRPLKNLNGTCFTEYSEQLYQVTHKLRTSKLKLNYEQFLKISASKVYLDIGYLTAKDIFHFIKSWQNGKVRENFDTCYWYRCSDIVQRELLRYLGNEVDEIAEIPKTCLHFEHRKDPKKFGDLIFDNFNFLIIFMVTNEE